MDSSSHHLLPLILTTLLFNLLPQTTPSQSKPPCPLNPLLTISASMSFPRHPRTAVIYPIRLPSNLSGVEADLVRYRSGSLTRHGSVFKEFSLSPGILTRPRTQRVIFVRHSLQKQSLLCFQELLSSRYRLVSPVVGLQAYDARGFNSTGDPRYIRIVLTGNSSVRIDFSGVDSVSEPLLLCAFFGADGRVSLSNQTENRVCSATELGHFALVGEAVAREGRVRHWKVVVWGVVGAVGASVLLGMLCVAVVKVRRRSLRAERIRRAYEEEALRVSMVGHARAHVADAMRTRPDLEND
ncbi:hypothetical protein QJS04_geneDACA000916 [Acorus gramineus]|uniref:Uncharacterized protein n=1 Tax=Acorus gramineus TaxID=55184 RepID=A0AAV9ACA0_ACOGR|nr:hypothetical protein QJS04_geneDACA000916 [Acorus gramineus]